MKTDFRSCKLQAHRGVSYDRPENTMIAYKEAIAQGYDLIELDPKFTLDNKCVLLHDKTLNRTARDKDGNPPKTEKLAIKSITYAEACEYEYGSWFDEKYKGEHIPTLEEVLAFSKETKMPLKFDNIMQDFTDEQLDIFFTEVEKSGISDSIGFTGSKLEYLDKVLDRFPNTIIHFDGLWNDESREHLTSRVKEGNLYVWLRYDNKATSWNKFPAVTEETAADVKKYARLGLWLLSEREELENAINLYHADLVETNGSLKPVKD